MKMLKWTIASAIILASVGIVAAQQKAVIKEVAKAKLATISGKELLVKSYDVPQGWKTPKHAHTGQVWLYVQEGEGAMLLDGKPHKAKAGEIMKANAGEVMIMQNGSSSTRLKFLVIQIGDRGYPYIKMIK